MSERILMQRPSKRGFAPWMIMRLGILVAWALCASGCNGTSRTSKPDPGTTRPPEGPYVLGQGDVIGIIVHNDEKASGQFPIGPEGTFFHPYVGDVQAAGLTKAQLQAVLTKELGRLIKEPNVVIGIVTYRPQRVFVMGEVQRAGEVLLIKRMTLLEVIGAAGGFTEWANRGSVRVLRRGVEAPFIINVKRVQTGRAPDDFIVQADDQITVPRRTF